MMNDQLSKHIIKKLFVATFENRIWFTIVYTSFLNKPHNLSLHPYVAKRDSQFYFMKYQNTAIFEPNLYQIGAQYSVLFQCFSQPDVERQSSICRLKLEITFAIIKLLYNLINIQTPL